MKTVAPFPWFGGKSRAASLVWSVLGNVDNYVEPFFGSGAVLLQRPEPRGIVTVNDADGHLVNVWRALSAVPELVAEWCDWPVTECDLTARHLWLVKRRAELTARLQVDPDYYDAQAAGWWIWGACAWIGSGWCAGTGPWTTDGEGWINGDAGMGINRKLPHVGDAGRGINRKLPHVGDAGRGAAVAAWFMDIASQLRGARICCGDWSRVCTPTVTFRHGMTGVMLDPPYPAGFSTDAAYAGQTSEAADLWRDVVAWCEEFGPRSDMRIVLCGYEDAGEPPKGWRRAYWTARKGYQSTAGAAGANPERETLWLSPACLEPGQLTARPVSLFGGAA